MWLSEALWVIKCGSGEMWDVRHSRIFLQVSFRALGVGEAFFVMLHSRCEVCCALEFV